MKKIKNPEKYSDSEWEELASSLSEEKSSESELFMQFTSEDTLNTGKLWKEIKKRSGDKQIDIDKAWNKLYPRLHETGTSLEKSKSGTIFIRSNFLKIAAAVLTLVVLGVTALYLGKTDYFSKKIVVATDINQKNLEVTLPDGSTVVLNRNTELSYSSNFGKSGRQVALSGEAFFNITSDAGNPFTVDAGSAQVKALGTSFNVITNNTTSAVEVYVKTGQVMLSDNSGDQTLVIDPGYVGIIDSKHTTMTLNDNPNYMALNTGFLKYDGQTLDIVFRDLKRVYNMEIIADDPAILNETWTSPIDNQPQDTIIRLICASFNLSYSKDGNIYHLFKK